MDNNEIINKYLIYNKLNELVKRGDIDLFCDFIKEEYGTMYDISMLLESLSYNQIFNEASNIIAFKAKMDVIKEIIETAKIRIINNYNKYLELSKKIEVEK